MTRRLVLSYLLVTVIVLAILEIPLAIFYGQLERERFVTRAERDAVVLGSFYETSLETGLPLDPDFADRYAQRVGARAVVVDQQAISLIDTSELPIGRDFSNRPEIEAALSGERASGFRHSDTLDLDLLYVAVPISSGGEIRGAARIAVDAATVTERIRRFQYGLLAVAVLVILLLSLVGWTIARSVTEPLRTLQTSARQFGRGEFSSIEPAADDAPPEIQDLTTTMNAMAGQLDQIIARHRSFVADTSHQLRTPLTALRLRLENLEAHDVGIDERIEIEAAIDETVRMSTMVNDLLRLARTDQIPAITAVDLGAMAAERVEIWRAVADQSSVGIALRRPRIATFAMSVAGGVEQVLDNLIDNALHASPYGSTIELAVLPGDQWHRLVVSDQGPGLTDEAKIRATERFWSGDSKPAGSGLGLAIVTSILEAGGGHLALEDGVSGGLSAVCWLAAAHRPQPTI